MKKCYLISTEHLEKMLWFRSEEDFKVGMNYVAIQAAANPKVTVLAFVLMSNHVHFVVMGDIEDVLAFVNQFKTRYSKYIQKKYGIKELLRRNKIHVKAVDPYEFESLQRVIAYIQMNPVAANICSHPVQYPWGTGNTFFNEAVPVAKRLGDYSKHALGRLLHSECDSLPPDWRITADGYILPQCYVDVDTVEKTFRSPNRMNYFYSSSSKARKRIESSEGNLPSFRDQIIMAAVPDLCRTLFQKGGFDQLVTAERSELLRQLRFRFSADVRQMARVCGLTYAETARLLDSE